MHNNVETSTVIIKRGFFAKIVILESRSACVILMCCNKQSGTPWSWHRQTRKCVRII